MELWSTIPGRCEEIPVITSYIPEVRHSDAAVVIFPGGGYVGRTDHEGVGYAAFLNQMGIAAFVVDYRVAPHTYPLPLLDARRAVRYVRAHAAEYGIDPHKVGVMGSSAGGHLVALTATCEEAFPEELCDAVDRQESRPDFQILCYPVICPPAMGAVSHVGSYQNLLGGTDSEQEDRVNPLPRINGQTPPAFIWHTADDEIVPVANSLRYAEALHMAGVETELHIFPHGPHGMGIAQGDPQVSQWTGLLIQWMRGQGLMNKGE